MATEPPQGPIQGELLPPDGMPRTNALAVVSLIAGILSIVLAAGSILFSLFCCMGLPAVALALVLGAAAAVCGHLALRQVTGTGQRGRQIAIVGLVTGYVGVGLSLAALLLMGLVFGFVATGAAAQGLEID